MSAHQEIGYSRFVRPSNLIVLIVLSGACNNSGHELREHVRNTCETLAADLDHDAKKHAEFATWARGRTPDETWKDADFTLPCRWSIESRMACAIQLKLRLSFCIKARQGKAVEDLTDRARIAIDSFGTSKAPDKVADAMRDLAAIAAEADALPMKD